MEKKNVTKRLEDVKQFVDTHDTFLLDCDGVLWAGNTLIPGIKETLEYLRSIGKKLVFVTNNSTKSRAQYLDKFKSLNIQAFESEVISSSFAVAEYLSTSFSKDQFDKEKHKVFVVGQEGIKIELQKVGIQSIGGEDIKQNTHTNLSDFDSFKPDPSVRCVIVGFDGWLNYTKLSYAKFYLASPSTIFICTNRDSTFPSSGKFPMNELPGAGSIVSSVETAAGRKPINTGKPSVTLWKIIQKEYNIQDTSRVCVVGDRLDTDILFGIEGKLTTVLVLTGVTSAHTVFEDKENDIHPDWVLDSFAQFNLSPNNK